LCAGWRSESSRRRAALTKLAFVKLKLSQTLSYKACLAREAGEDSNKCYQEAVRLMRESDIQEADEIRRGAARSRGGGRFALLLSGFLAGA
jgi:hypothetical protein